MGMGKRCEGLLFYNLIVQGNFLAEYLNGAFLRMGQNGNIDKMLFYHFYLRFILHAQTYSTILKR